MSNEYKIDITVRQSPVNQLYQVFVEGIALESLISSEADAEHIAKTYGSFPHDILKDMNELLGYALKQGEAARRERYVNDRDYQLMRHYQYIADIANAAVRVSLLMRNVK